MKKAIAITAATIAAIGLTGCVPEGNGLAAFTNAGETTNHHFLRDVNNGCVYAESKSDGAVRPVVYMNRQQLGCATPFTVPADRPMFAMYGSQEVVK